MAPNNVFYVSWGEQIQTSIIVSHKQIHSISKCLQRTRPGCCWESFIHSLICSKQYFLLSVVNLPLSGSEQEEVCCPPRDEEQATSFSLKLDCKKQQERKHMTSRIDSGIVPSLWKVLEMTQKAGASDLPP